MGLRLGGLKWRLRDLLVAVVFGVGGVLTLLLIIFVSNASALRHYSVVHAPHATRTTAQVWECSGGKGRVCTAQFPLAGDFYNVTVRGSHHVGDTAAVWYDPAHPTRTTEARSAAGVYAWPALCDLGVLALLFVAARAGLRRRRRRETSPALGPGWAGGEWA